MSDPAYGMQGYNDYDMYEEPDKMTYTEQANKRSNCRRLTRLSYITSFHQSRKMKSRGN